MDGCSAGSVRLRQPGSHTAIPSSGARSRAVPNPTAQQSAHRPTTAAALTSFLLLCVNTSRPDGCEPRCVGAAGWGAARAVPMVPLLGVLQGWWIPASFGRFKSGAFAQLMWWCIEGVGCWAVLGTLVCVQLCSCSSSRAPQSCTCQCVQLPCAGGLWEGLKAEQDEEPMPHRVRLVGLQGDGQQHGAVLVAPCGAAAVGGGRGNAGEVQSGGGGGGGGLQPDLWCREGRRGSLWVRDGERKQQWGQSTSESFWKSLWLPVWCSSWL